jgi:hypothetical protein
MNDTSRYNMGTGMGCGKKERDKRRRASCCREGRETGDKALHGYKNGYNYAKCQRRCLRKLHKLIILGP